MDDFFVWGGIAFGFVAIICYVKTFWAKLMPAYVFAGASMMGGSVGVASGTKVCTYSVIYAKVPPIKDISTASFMGGFAVCLVGLYTIYHRFKYRQ